MTKGLKHACLFAWPLFWLLLLAGESPAESGTLVLKKKAEVRGSEIVLDEVAQIKGFDEETARKLGQLRLGLSPRPGCTRFIPKETIEARLRAQEDLSPEIRLDGSEGVLVEVKSVLVDGQELMHLVKEFLKTQLSGLEGDFRIETLKQPQETLIPVGHGLTTFNVQWHNAPVAAGTASLDIQVLVDGTLFTSLPVQVNIRCYAAVLTAARDIARGEAFTAENTRLVRMETTRIAGVPALGIEELGPRLSKRVIAAGSVIRVGDGYLPAMVLRGQPVNVTVRKGALLIKGRGIARQDGTLRDIVEVINADSGLSFKAVVTGTNQVEIVL